MGFIKAIATLVNAFPALAKLFEKINSAIKEKNARERYNEKTDRIDAAIRDANGLSASKVEWGGSDAETSTVSSGGTSSTTIHKGSP